MIGYVIRKSELGLPIPRKILLPGERGTTGNKIFSPGNSPGTAKIGILAVESNKNYILINKQAYKIGILHKQSKALGFPEIFAKVMNFRIFCLIDDPNRQLTSFVMIMLSKLKLT